MAKRKRTKLQTPIYNTLHRTHTHTDLQYITQNTHTHTHTPIFNKLQRTHTHTHTDLHNIAQNTNDQHDAVQLSDHLTPPPHTHTTHIYTHTRAHTIVCVVQSLVFCAMFCRSLFVLILVLFLLSNASPTKHRDACVYKLYCNNCITQYNTLYKIELVRLRK